MKNADYILGKIIDAANHNVEIINFSEEVLEILHEHKLISQAVYEILKDE